MSLLELYNRSTNRQTKTTESPNYPVPVATQKSNLPATDSEILTLVDEYYANAPILKSSYLGDHAQPLVFSKPNEQSDDYSGRLNYTLTRASATAKWLISPEGLKSSLLQASLQGLNPTLETKIWKPNSIFSNLIPFTGYHERRHMTLSSLFGIPTSFIAGDVPASYTEALTSGELGSRNIFQSPILGLSSKEYAGIDYAHAGRDVMAYGGTWKSLNPNRYKFPIGTDGGGLPNSNVMAPQEEMSLRMGLAAQAWRYTKSVGFNPVLESQITMNKQLTGTSFLQNLLRSIPFVNTAMAIFGYGILGADAQKIKIYNPYNPTFPYSKNKGKQIRVVDDDGKLLDTYDLTQDIQSPIERLLYAITEGSKFGEKAQTGITFVNKAALPGFDQFTEIVDKRVTKNPQDGTDNLNQYLQTYGDISNKRAKNKSGTVDPSDTDDLNLFDKAKSYTQYMDEDTNNRIIYKPGSKGRGFAWSGAPNEDDRQGDALNLLEYGEDSADKDFEDLIPFKFYHVNERKWIVFRASLTGLTDNTSPTWNAKEYVGRADKQYIYKGADRKINFNFSIMIHNPKELRPIYEKVNYLNGLCWPTYKQLSNGWGQYMEAPFVKLTIGDLFDDVAGILDGGVTITFDDDATWEIRDEHPQSLSDIDKIKIAKVPRLLRITIGSFTPFSLDNKPISSTSPFYSAVKRWQNETV